MPETSTGPSTMKETTAYTHAPFAFEQPDNSHDGDGGLDDLIPRIQAISSSPKHTVAFEPRGKSGEGMRGDMLSEDEGNSSMKSRTEIEAGDHALWKEGTKLEKDAEQWVKGQRSVFSHQDVVTASTVSMQSFQRAEVVRVDRSFGGNDGGGDAASSSSGNPVRLGEGGEATDDGVPCLPPIRISTGSSNSTSTSTSPSSSPTSPLQSRNKVHDPAYITREVPRPNNKNNIPLQPNLSRPPTLPPTIDLDLDLNLDLSLNLNLNLDLTSSHPSTPPISPSTPNPPQTPHTPPPPANTLPYPPSPPSSPLGPSTADIADFLARRDAADALDRERERAARRGWAGLKAVRRGSVQFVRRESGRGKKGLEVLRRGWSLGGKGKGGSEGKGDGNGEGKGKEKEEKGFSVVRRASGGYEPGSRC